MHSRSWIGIQMGPMHSRQSLPSVEACISFAHASRGLTHSVGICISQWPAFHGKCIPWRRSICKRLNSVGACIPGNTHSLAAPAIRRRLYSVQARITWAHAFRRGMHTGSNFEQVRAVDSVRMIFLPGPKLWHAIVLRSVRGRLLIGLDRARPSDDCLRRIR